MVGSTTLVPEMRGLLRGNGASGDRQKSQCRFQSVCAKRVFLVRGTCTKTEQNSSVESQKGVIAIDFVQQYYAILVLNGTLWNSDNALLALNSQRNGVYLHI